MPFMLPFCDFSECCGLKVTNEYKKCMILMMMLIVCLFRACVLSQFYRNGEWWFDIKIYVKTIPRTVLERKHQIYWWCSKSVNHTTFIVNSITRQQPSTHRNKTKCRESTFDWYIYVSHCLDFRLLFGGVSNNRKQ